MEQIEQTAQEDDFVTKDTKSVKRLAYFVGGVSLTLAAIVALVVGISASLPFRGVRSEFFGRPFWGTLIGVPTGLAVFAATINLLGHLLGVRKEAIAVFVTPPARFMTSGGKAVNTSLLISTMAVMLAIGIVLNVLSFSFPGFGGRASFVYLFMYLSGILFGPVYGFVVAFAGDLIGFSLAPEGMYSPFIGIGNGITATVVALIFKLKFSNKFYKDALLVLFTFVCMATILSAYYFGPFVAPGTVNQTTGAVSSGSGLHNGARVVIIAAVASLLIYGLYKIISIKTHDESGKERPQWFVKLLLGAVVAFVPATLILGSYGVYSLGWFPSFGMAALARLISQPVWVGINLFLLYLLIPPLNRTVFRHYPIE